MAKFLDSTGLTTLWAKIKTLFSRSDSYTTPTTDTKGHWTVTIPGVTRLYDGLKIHIRLGTAYYANNEQYNTLNVNGLGAKIVWYRYNSRLTSHLSTNAELTLTYRTAAGSYKVTTSTGELTNGTTYTDGWVCDYVYDNNDTQTSALYNTRPYTGDYVLYAYKLCVFNEKGRLVPLVKTDGTGTSKVQLDTAFRPEKIYYNNYWSSIAANSQCYSELKSSCAFSATRTFNANVPANNTMYLVGSYNNGLFTLDQTSTTSWYLFVPNSTSFTSLYNYFTKGKYYIKIGCSGASANSVNLEEVNTLYYFDGFNLSPCTSVANNLHETFSLSYTYYHNYCFPLFEYSTISEETISGYSYTFPPIVSFEIHVALGVTTSIPVQTVLKGSICLTDNNPSIHWDLVSHNDESIISKLQNITWDKTNKVVVLKCDYYNGTSSGCVACWAHGSRVNVKAINSVKSLSTLSTNLVTFDIPTASTEDRIKALETKLTTYNG